MVANLVAEWSGLLTEPPAPVQVHGVIFYLHPAILRKSAFFAEMLDLPGEAPNVELPCTAQDFVLLALALYHDEELGSPRLPIPDFATGTRLLLAADMMGVAHALSADALADAVSSLEDLAAAALFASTHPGLCGELESLVPDKILRGVRDATDPWDWEQVMSALEAFHGRLEAEQLVEAAKGRLHSLSVPPTDIEFVARIAAEFLNVWDSTRIFEDPGRGYPSRFGDEGLRVYVEARQRHLLRCAEEGAWSKLLEPSSCLPEQMVERIGMLKDSPLEKVLRASAPDQAKLILSHLSHHNLWEILSAEVLEMASPESQRSLMQPLIKSSCLLSLWAERHGGEALVAISEPLRQTIIRELGAFRLWRILPAKVLDVAAPEIQRSLMQPLLNDSENLHRWADKHGGGAIAAIKGEDLRQVIIRALGASCLWTILSADVLAAASPEIQRLLMQPLLKDLESLRRWADKHGGGALAAIAEPLRQAITRALGANGYRRLA